MKFLIVDEMHPSILPLLQELGIEPDYRPKIKPDEIGIAISDYEGIIVRSKIRIDEKILDKATKLKYVCRAGAGVDNIDEKALAARNLILINAPEGNRDAVAEHMVAMLLTLFNRIHIADREVRNGVWDREGNRGYELKSKCIALIGYGFMGKAVAKRLKSFGCEVIAYDKYLENFSDEFVREVSMDELREKADIFTLHIPLTHESKELVNFQYLNQFKKDIWFVNTARGEIVKLKDLVEVMKSGKVKGAALDVLENEKLQTLTEEQKASFEYLASSDKVLLSPHVGGWTFESYQRINEVIVDKLKRHLSVGGFGKV